MKKFLTAFAGIASAFAANASIAPAATAIAAPSVDSQNIVALQATVLGENITTIDAKGDEYNFILKRSEETGLIMAGHRSHASHASHSSHSSHYSSR